MSDFRFGKEFWIAASLGLVDGVYKSSFFGRNPIVGNVETTLMDISELAGERYPFLAAPAGLSISSSNVADTQEVMIEYLDENYLFGRTTGILNGQTEVDLGLVTPAIRVLEIKNNDGTPTLGNVYCFPKLSPLTAGVPSTPTNILAKFTINSQESNMAVYSVPAGFTLAITKINFTSGENQSSTMCFYTRALGKSFLQAGCVDLFNSNGFVDYEQSFPTAPEKTDIDVTGSVASATAGMSCFFNSFLFDNAKWSVDFSKILLPSEAT